MSILSFKDANDQDRWLIISSNNYRDRDNEIISLAAHLKDCDRMRETGEYGVLNWWHVYIDKSGPEIEFVRINGMGLDEFTAKTKSGELSTFAIGRCDFSEMHDGFRIESGTYTSKEAAELIKNYQGDLKISPEFFTTGTDDDLVHSEIHTVNRSLLPAFAPANFMTATIKENDMTTALEKVKALFGSPAAKAVGDTIAGLKEGATALKLDSKEANADAPEVEAVEETETEVEETEAADAATPEASDESAADDGGKSEAAVKEDGRIELIATAVGELGVMVQAMQQTVNAQVANFEAANEAAKATNEAQVKEINDLKLTVKSLMGEAPQGVLAQLMASTKSVTSDDAPGEVIEAKEKNWALSPLDLFTKDFATAHTDGNDHKFA